MFQILQESKNCFKKSISWAQHTGFSLYNKISTVYTPSILKLRDDWPIFTKIATYKVKITKKQTETNISFL